MCYEDHASMYVVEIFKTKCKKHMKNDHRGTSDRIIVHEPIHKTRR